MFIFLVFFIFSRGTSNSYIRIWDLGLACDFCEIYIGFVKNFWEPLPLLLFSEFIRMINPFYKIPLIQPLDFWFLFRKLLITLISIWSSLYMNLLICCCCSCYIHVDRMHSLEGNSYPTLIMIKDDVFCCIPPCNELCLFYFYLDEKVNT